MAKYELKSDASEYCPSLGVFWRLKAALRSRDEHNDIARRAYGVKPHYFIWDRKNNVKYTS